MPGCNRRTEMTALAEYPALPDTALLGKTGIWALQPALGAFTVERDKGAFGYPVVSPHISDYAQRMGSGWVNLGDQVKVVFVVPSSVDVVGLNPPVGVRSAMPTTMALAPAFETSPGTGDLFNEIRDTLDEVWHGHDAVAPGTSTAAGSVLLDVSAALQQARSQAGLPVQDLAAMFGIKRRQFYNLSSGEQQPEPEREPRIARVTAAIDEISGWVGHSSRKVRVLLLARLDGDSIYDAAVADDEERLAEAIERTYTAAAEGKAMRHRLAPSNRATPAEAAAVREFLRANRDDDTGSANEP